eukprot:Nk52_evm14s295 gene=Nk52_evmTU14s295
MNRRKSLLGFSPAQSDLSENDDAKEKKARRKSKMNELRNKLISSPVPSPRKGSNLNPNNSNSESSDVLKPTNQQVGELYANCIKLSAENKINQKNSWNLNLIDYISEVMDVRHGEVTNFQMASCTLDASVQIYSCRVDSVHTDMFKVLNGLNRGGSRKHEEGGDEDDEGDDQDGKKVKKSYRKVNTIVKQTNLDSINVKKMDLEFDVDPLFKKTSAEFDEGGAKGLLLNHLCVHNGCELIFDSTDACDVISMDDTVKENNVEVNISELSEMLINVCDGIGDKSVCPSFESFTFDHQQQAKQIVQSESSMMVDDGPSAIEDFDGNDFGGSDFGNDFGGDSGLDDYDDTPTDFFGSDMNGSQPQQTQRDNPFLELVASLAPGDNSYFKASSMKNWAGPSHWKVKSVAAASSVPKPKRVKEKFFIDFSKPVVIPRGKKTNTTLTASTLERFTSKNTTLPEDLHYDTRNMVRLFTKKGLFARRRKFSDMPTGGENEDEKWYNYENRNDEVNFCPNVVVDDYDVGGDGNDDYFIAGHEDTEQPVDRLANALLDIDLGDNSNLVAAPKKVEKIEINYARVAKKIDVRKLKTGMWEILKDPEGDKENVPTEEVYKEKNFTQLVSQCEKQEEKAQEDSKPSVPICFVCLLHLANEKGLDIQSNSNLNELKISQGVF